MPTDLTAYRAEFPITEKYAFLSHAAVSPLSRRAAKAVEAHLELIQTKAFGDYFGEVFGLQKDLQQRIVALINAQGPDEIALMPNTATGLNTAAASLPLQPGDNVLVLDGDYPANIYPWLNLAHRGILTKFVPQRNGGLDLELLKARLDRRTRVIALSTVIFATGFRNDLAAVGQLCQERGIFFVVDGIQSLGAFPMDVREYQIDFLAAGSQKWLLSTPGCGFLYCRRELIEQLAPGAYVGAASVVDPMNYLDYNFTLAPNADRFNLGTPNLTGMVALQATLALLQEIGIERISQQILLLIETLINDLHRRGYQLAASTELAQRSGIVVAHVEDALAACEKLAKANVIVTPRGPGVRIAPHFYNTVEEVLRVGEVLGDARP